MSQNDNRSSGLGVTAGDLDRYFTFLRHVLVNATATRAAGESLDYAAAVTESMQLARATHDAGRKIMFIGNGGSAAIASHMATDYSKNGGLRAMAMNDGATLTCLSNDLGYENVFSTQIGMHANEGDLLVAISSSGRSESITRAVRTAREKGCAIMTLSGFAPGNPLRDLGDLNFYVASDQYGYVEIAHLAICHAVLDFSCGLVPPTLS
ncbi:MULTISPECIES: SIS domain-containing protein [Rhizobium]|jgi:D-sedoheptulose 7-phosphate isomerase|uniref:SIS domain-containing protein n=1 Tax=Rhizobium TaxID=379 RepID=UPI00037ED89E|nr:MULTISPECIES: SIS domain-containing protein [Rhizobium]MBB4509313.1 D-sedoheptulose 7-phosphate isomerase [Rhizobium leguminosarum]NEH28109.1 SIS domain-containing protein [Rhizobium ruizarguesonis]NEH61789.1 SIS domain-containing protein [Rhizobium ruizarguesonis]NEK07527.1 SIS domain-containing protein [Rhizobium ruizarguesonis]TAY62973.1 SIS domain-containing protein [Rhizobium ruizarguesonis]